MTPNRIIDELEISKLSAQGLEGSFVILPDHIDLLSALEQSIVTVRDASGTPSVFAVDGGILVKKGENIQISSPLVVKGKNLSETNPEDGLSAIVRDTLDRLKKDSRDVQNASLRLECDLVRRMIELRGGL